MNETVSGSGPFARSRAALAMCALVIALASCSDATTPDVRTPTTIVPAADSIAFTALGQLQVLTATVLDQDGLAMTGATSMWTSSAGTVATVTPAGVVTAVGNGTALLTVTSGGASAQVTVSVAQVAGALVLSMDSVVLKDPGDTTRLAAAAFDSRGSSIDAPTVTWMSADDGIASVDSTGLVTAAGTGTVVITASADGVSAQTSARVEPEVTLVAVGPTAHTGGWPRSCHCRCGWRICSAAGTVARPSRGAREWDQVRSHPAR